MAWRILLFTYTNMDCQQEVKNKSARLAQSVERETFNLRVMGSSPMPSKYFFTEILKNHFIRDLLNWVSLTFLVFTTESYNMNNNIRG